MQGMSTNYAILLFYITAEAATGGLLDLARNFQPHPQSNFKKRYVFGIAANVFLNLFLKICPLFGQILITCVKCSNASFSPSSYSQKMCRRRGCIISTFPNLIS